MSDAKVSDLGENALIERLTARLPKAPRGEVWSGDDGAVIEVPRPQVVTTDCLVQGVDFSLDYGTGADAAWKALAANVSDVAAMGCVASHAVVTLGIHGHSSIDLFDSILDGLLEAAEHFGVALVGGDITEAPDLFLSVTMLGGGSRPLLRSGARAGDALCVTGHLGGARGGLVVLQRGLPQEGAFEDLAARQLRPRPSATAGSAIAAAGATSMIDISDGLAIDLLRLMDASGTGCNLDTDAIPVDPGAMGLGRALEDVDPLEMAITGGEDFELLFTIPPIAVGEVRGADLSSVSVIGEVGSAEPMLAGRTLEEWKERSWQHLRGP